MGWHIIYSGEKPFQLVLEATFWYPGGEFQMATDWPFDDSKDIRKKTLTDFTGKALSKLGFSADIYYGEYDSAADIKNKQKEKAKTSTSKKQPQKDEAEMSQGELVKKCKGEVFKVAAELKGSMDKDTVVKLIKDTAEQLKVDLDSFDGIHAVKAELSNLLKIKNNVKETFKG
jgi:hypothetical protein